MEEIIEINGIKYIPRETKSHTSKKANQIMILASLFGDVNTGYKRARPNVNTIEEFKKIQEKRSLLSRNDRDFIVWEFNQLYHPVSEK